ncbi:ATPase [Haloferax elongans ATCC BAA-1513]|uniref:ATPase n=1 Tax=Haloferax elongans ATCC BAA-1513 TaxID=1230453 RepID=M0HJU9_HALEO|nr:MoxR family ATPase [Haloferax elongans]ELZ84771.1 ATPase [Haloferax elongans ATCC BAA-1513]
MTDVSEIYQALAEEMETVLVGNAAVVEGLTIALLTGGHVLIEGVPGVAKTTIAASFARSTGLDTRRIQLTPDVLPADLTGTKVYREQTGTFEIQKGPVFTNVVVADEINRATPKTQSALLEAMQEGTVTIEGDTLSLPDPFLVVATQNPIEMEGTFELPKAQRDRFQLKYIVDLPSDDEEHVILDRFDTNPDLSPLNIQQVITMNELESARDAVDEVFVDDDVKQYIVDLVTETREHPAVAYGASPRASIGLLTASKARAALHGRDYVTPDDVKVLAKPTVAHRIVLRPDAVFGDVDERGVVDEVVESVSPPGVADTADEASSVADGGTDE